jgi:hypothetical protein
MTIQAAGQQLNDVQASRRVSAAKLLRRSHLAFRAAIAQYRFARADAEKFLGKDDARELVRLWMRRQESQL